MPEIAATQDMMSPMALFLHADVVVKAVMIGLLLASIWTWGIIITHSLRLKRINQATDSFEKDFWAAEDIDAFHLKRGKEPPSPGPTTPRWRWSRRASRRRCSPRPSACSPPFRR